MRADTQNRLERVSIPRCFSLLLLLLLLFARPINPSLVDDSNQRARYEFARRERDARRRRRKETALCRLGVGFEWSDSAFDRQRKNLEAIERCGRR